jgi:hypothetical protein
MEHRVELTAAEHAIEERPIREIADDELAGDRLGVAVDQVVEDDRVMPGLQQRSNRVSANVPGPARHQQSHNTSKWHFSPSLVETRGSDASPSFTASIDRSSIGPVWDGAMPLGTTASVPEL